MKKILFIIPVIPYPLTSGGNQAFYNMVDYIRYHMSVSILLCASSKEEKERVEALKTLWKDVTFFVYKRVKSVEDRPTVRHPFYFKLLDKCRASIERKMRRQLYLAQNTVSVVLSNMDLARERSILFHSIFKELDEGYVEYVAKIAKSGFDIIQVEFYELIALGYVLPKEVQTIFVHHELRHVRSKNEMAFYQKITSNDMMHFLISKDFERDALQNYNHVIALTEVDRKLLTAFIGNQDCIYTSPAVVQLHEDSSAYFTPCTCNRFTFVGFGGHYPNLDAIIWFCDEVAPILRKSGFKFTLQVAGVGYESYLDEIQLVCPEIEMVGYVDKLETFLQGSIALVPIRIGSGMRMKILDVVSLKVPFITTSKGLEGINFNHHDDCLIADNAVDFATAMVELSGDPQLQEKLVNSAKAKLATLYNPQKMLERRMSIYTSILNKNI